jgi:Viral BACON domain
VRVICCPNCQESLPEIAKFCARCGEHLPTSAQSRNMVDEDLIASTIEINHPHMALRATRSYAMNNSTRDTSPQLTATVQQSRRNGLISSSQTLPLTLPPLSEQDMIDDELLSRANWEKVVTHKTSCVTPEPVNPPVMPVVYKPLVVTTPPALIFVRRAPPKEPPRLSTRFVSWISILALLCLLLGGVFGLAVSYGRGFLAQDSHTSNIFALKVTPLNAAIGGIITLHGTAFSPDGKVGLTRDANITLIDTGGTDIIHAGSQGSFSDTVIVDPSWGAGSHIIHAEDAILHKSASFTVFVTGQGISLRPSHLLFSPDAINLGSGDQTMNSTQIVTLSNTGSGQINWKATATQPWLLISPKSGTLSFNQKMNVEVAADRSNLRVGAYTTGLVFHSNTEQAALPVKMIVTQLQPGHKAVLQLTPALLSFTGTDGAANPLSQVVTVSNPGVLPLEWSATSVTSDGAGWLSMYPLSGTVDRGSNQPVTISINTSILLPGVYNGSITFASEGEVAAKDSPQTIFVSLVITPQCSIQISPGGLNFASAYLQRSPAGQAISLGTSQGCSASLPWSTAVTTSSGGNWLSIGPTRGVTPANPVVTVNSTGLNPGSYSGSIIFNWHAGTQTLPVTFIVGLATTPVIAAAPATVALSGIIGQSGPLTQTITITNPGGETLAWHASAVSTIGGAWLAISQTSGTISPHSSSLTTVTGTVLGTLTAGTYTGTVTIAAIDSVTKLAVGPPMVIPVTLTIQPVCILQLPSSPSMTFSAKAGLNPAPQTFTVGVVGACAGNVTITPTATLSSGKGWLAVSAPVRVISGASAIFTVTITSAGLAEGKYTGSISLAALNGSIATSGSPQVVGITLNVLAAPALTAEQGSVAFNVSTGIVSQPITITNSGGSAFNWTAALDAGAPSYVSLSATTGTNLAGGTIASINVIVDATGLAGGTSVTTNVIVSAIDPLTGQPVSGSPVSVSVTINIPPPEMVLSVTSLAFTTTLGINPAAQMVNVQNPGGNTLAWTVGTPTQPWLVVSPTTGSDAAGQVTPITFNVNVTGLTAGTYNAPVIITPSVGTPVTVNVALTIN